MGTFRWKILLFFKFCCNISMKFSNHLTYRTVLRDVHSARKSLRVYYWWKVKEETNVGVCFWKENDFIWSGGPLEKFWEMIEPFLSVLVGYLKLEAERASASGTSIFMQNSLGHLNNNKCVRFRLRLQFGSSIFYFKQVVRKIGYEIDWINNLVTYRDVIIVITCWGKLKGFILLNILLPKVIFLCDNNNRHSVFLFNSEFFNLSNWQNSNLSICLSKENISAISLLI